MQLTELFDLDSYRRQLTAFLFKNAPKTGVGCRLTALDLQQIIGTHIATHNNLDAPTRVLKTIVDAIVLEDPTREIMVVKNGERGLLHYGYKLSKVSVEVEIMGDGVTESDSVGIAGLFGSPIPADVRLQIETVRAGTGDKAYDRPVATLSIDYKNEKGKIQAARLQVGIADTVKAQKIEYREWVGQCLGKDEDELIEAGLMADWTPPRTGSLVNKVRLSDLGENADQFGPQTYEILGVTVVSQDMARSGYSEVGFTLRLAGDENNEIMETWTEVQFSLEKTPKRGGLGYSTIVGDALACGVPYYLHVVGSKPKMIWDKITGCEKPYLDKQGRSWRTIDGFLSDDPAIPRRCFKQANPAVQPANTIAATQEPLGHLKPAAIVEFVDDIPF